MKPPIQFMKTVALFILFQLLTAGLRPLYAQNYISGDYYVSGNAYEYGDTITVDAGSSLRFITGDWVLYTRQLKFNGPAATVINASGSPRIYIDNPASGGHTGGVVRLTANGVTIPSGLTLINSCPYGVNMDSGNLVIDGALHFATAEYNGNSIVHNILRLNSRNLIFTSAGTVTGADGDSYVVTNGMGVIRKQSVTASGTFTYPVGTGDMNDYTPASIKNGSVIQDLDVRVGTYHWPGFTIPHYGGFADLDGINRTWEVRGMSGSLSGVSLTHNDSTEGANYALSAPNAYVTQYFVPDHAWTLGTLGTEAQVGSAKTLAAVTPLPLGSGVQYYSKTVNTSIALPLSLSGFTGRTDSLCRIILHWSADNTEDIKFFRIEYSSNGMQYKVAGEVMAYPTPGTSGGYTFRLEDVDNGKGYFRLSGYRSDGSFVRAPNTVLVQQFCQDTKVSIFPNPVKDKAYVRYHTPTGRQIQLLVVDASGRQLYMKAQRVLTGENLIEVPVFGQLSTGVYQVILMDGLQVHYLTCIRQ